MIEKLCTIRAIVLIAIVLVAFCGGVGCSADEPSQVNKDGIAVVFSEPMNCVDHYYDAVMKCNYGQYQYCVLVPMPIEEFQEKANKRSKEMSKHGIKPVVRPVRGRSDFKENKGSRSVNVKAVSPWTNKEETYLVTAQGQSWKIVKEK